MKVSDKLKQLTSYCLLIDGIPQVFFFGKESNRFIMIMELLDRNLETVFVQEGQRKHFSTMTVVMIVDQMVRLGSMRVDVSSDL